MTRLPPVLHSTIQFVIRSINPWFRAGLLLSVLFLSACASHGPAQKTASAFDATSTTSANSAQTPPAYMFAAQWDQLPGWQDDSLTGVSEAFAQSCQKLIRQALWRSVCEQAPALKSQSAAFIRDFFQKNFTPFRLSKASGPSSGLITGYYVPVLRGSRHASGPYRYALYHWPAQWKARHAVYPKRETLLDSGNLRGSELIYVEDPIEAFFAEVQGSVQILLDNGEIVRLGFDGSNGQPYHSIGRWLIEKRGLTLSQVSKQGIQAWAASHPDQIASLINANPRMIFFKEMSPGAHKQGPVGALGVALTSERSIAVDPQFIPLGVPVFLNAMESTGKPLQRLVFAQDTGAAIKGMVRADYYFGLGNLAGERAGRMHSSGIMWVLWPNSH